jgi:NodT family efflux transporter outer membrane factor (OMF) lipoprotein
MMLAKFVRKPQALRIRRTGMLATAACCALVAGCAVGPNYKRPPVETPPAFKESADWTPVRPADDVDRGAWWSVFNDPVLDDLEAKVAISNQTLAAAEAAYREARALTAEQEAGLFPTVNLTGSGTRSKRGAGGVTVINSSGATSGASGGTSNAFQVSLGASWAPDLWGKIRRGVEGAKAGAQASAAEVAAAKLSAQSELAADYVQLRLADAQKLLLQQTVAAYARSLKITQNQYAAGVTAESDVLAAKGQLASAQASLINVGAQRAQSEHAIALLIGRPPSDLSIAPLPDWTPVPPTTPLEAPSVLLQRRPDVANAERLAAQASAQIGVQVAGYFPALTLSGSGNAASTVAQTLFKSANSGWSIGASAAETVFNGALTAASVRQARAAYDEAVAQYRQTVLTAFGQVEDDLAAARVLQAEEAPLREAAQEDEQTVQILLNQYRAGTVAYTSVVVAQATALTARQTLLTVQVQRDTTAISLIEALGGGWSGAMTP